MKDTKFAVAVHIMTYAAEYDQPVTSDSLAETINTNPSYIRKIMALLKKAGLTDSGPGRQGIALNKAPEDITLWEIYQAVGGTEDVLNFGLYQTIDRELLLCAGIRDSLSDIFVSAENDVRIRLKEKTLASFIKDGKRHMYEK